MQVSGGRHSPGKTLSQAGNGLDSVRPRFNRLAREGWPIAFRPRLGIARRNPLGLGLSENVAPATERDFESPCPRLHGAKLSIELGGDGRGQ